MLALGRIEAETNSLGISKDVATDSANEFAFDVPLPTTDWSLHALGAAQQKYYAKYDTDPKNPLNRAGHLWSVRLKPTEGDTTQ